MEDSITGNIKTGKNIHTELLRLSDDAEKKNNRNFKSLPKGNSLKMKSQEKQVYASKLENAFQVLQEKKKRLCNGQLIEKLVKLCLYYSLDQSFFS